MASNGIVNKAKNGKCRICQRTRSTEKHLRAVGEVHHGFATGYIWECIEKTECKIVAIRKLYDNKTNGVAKVKIEVALKEGPFENYRYFS